MAIARRIMIDVALARCLGGRIMKSLAGSFLIARPVLQDPNFRQTVVLLLQHNAEGAFGLVVNRPAKSKGLPFPVFKGGPCGSQGMLLLHGHPEWLDEAKEAENKSVAPGILIGDAACLTRVTDPPKQEDLRFRLFSGYAGWGPQQLERELATGSWAIAPATAELLFDSPYKELWQQLVPPAIPMPSLN
ncbi:MAG: YqgE/AlgH family protein [Gemmataceae bacterium]|nr:YqgE/AlgH family protein [Gemmataceae bacterium]